MSSKETKKKKEVVKEESQVATGIAYDEVISQLTDLQNKIKEGGDKTKFLFIVEGEGEGQIYGQSSIRDLSKFGRGFAEMFLGLPENRSIVAQGINIIFQQADNFTRIISDTVGAANWERIVNEDRKAIESIKKQEAQKQNAEKNNK